MNCTKEKQSCGNNPCISETGGRNLHFIWANIIHNRLNALSLKSPFLDGITFYTHTCTYTHRHTDTHTNKQTNTNTYTSHTHIHGTSHSNTNTYLVKPSSPKSSPVGTSFTNRLFNAYSTAASFSSTCKPQKSPRPENLKMSGKMIFAII